MNDQLWIAALFLTGVIAEAVGFAFTLREYRRTREAVEDFDSHVHAPPISSSHHRPEVRVLRQRFGRMNQRIEASEIMLYELSASLPDRMKGILFLGVGIALTMISIAWTLLLRLL
jgi:hypothetical protein